MATMWKIGAATALFAAVAVNAGYVPAPGYDIPEGATLLPPSQECPDNPPIPFIPFTPEGDPPPPENGCEPAIVFCGLMTNASQRVDWCDSGSGMPASWGWSNNVDFATGTTCIIGAGYTDCDLDNDEGTDIGTVTVNLGTQTFTVNVNAGIEISSYNIHTGPNLDTSVSADYTTYQTRGDAVVDGDALTLADGATFAGSDWFAMHVMYCEVDTPTESPVTPPEVFGTCATLEFENECNDGGNIQADCSFLYPGDGERTCGANGVCHCGTGDDEDACGCSQAPPTSCPAFDLDFDDAARGEYVRTKWASSHGVVITASPNSECEDSGYYVPNGAARVFDTANPGSASAGDPDLGSPNKLCENEPGYDMGGVGTNSDKYPGRGIGGVPNATDEYDHSNCVPQGKTLIIQEKDKNTPDDAACGGTITFNFYHTPAYVGEMGFLDVDDGESVKLTTVLDDGTSFFLEIPGYGDNSMVRRPVNLDNVRKLVVHFTGSGTISYIKNEICPEGGAFPGTCTLGFFQNECDTDSQCSDRYGSDAGATCGAGGVCFCNSASCACPEVAEPVPARKLEAAPDSILEEKLVGQSSMKRRRTRERKFPYW